MINREKIKNLVECIIVPKYKLSEEIADSKEYFKEIKRIEEKIFKIIVDSEYLIINLYELNDEIFGPDDLDFSFDSSERVQFSHGNYRIIDNRFCEIFGEQLKEARLLTDDKIRECKNKVIHIPSHPVEFWGYKRSGPMIRLDAPSDTEWWRGSPKRWLAIKKKAFKRDYFEIREDIRTDGTRFKSWFLNLTEDNHWEIIENNNLEKWMDSVLEKTSLPTPTEVIDLEKLIKDIKSGSSKIDEKSFEKLANLWDKIEKFGSGSIAQKDAFERKRREIDQIRDKIVNESLKSFLTKTLKSFSENKLRITSFDAKAKNILILLLRCKGLPNGNWQREAYEDVNNSGGAVNELDNLVNYLQSLGKRTSTKEISTINEIKRILETNQITLRITYYYINSGDWLNDFRGKSDGEIEKNKKKFLDNIYQTIAKYEIEKELAELSISLEVLKIGDNLANYLKSFSGEDEIKNEKNRLINLIKTTGSSKKTTIDSAKEDIKKALKDAGFEGKEEKVLGRDWANVFTGSMIMGSSQIESKKNKIIDKINSFVSTITAFIDTTVKEITQGLAENGFSESIFESNWKDNFSGKDKDEIIAEKDKLLQLIMKKQKENAESTDPKEREKAKKIIKKTVDNRKINVTKEIKEKLKKGHEKLILKISELPLKLFTPYQSLEEKMNSLNELEDITSFQTSLSAAIDEKKKEKLIVIANNAIAEIKKEINEAGIIIEFGEESKNWEEAIKSLKDPDDIETVKENIKKIISEQKQSSQNNDGIIVDSSKKKSLGSNDNEKANFSLPQKIGIVSGIILFLGIISSVIIKNRQRLKGK